MNFPPNPMHPAIVHFPIVLIVLGTFVAGIAVFWRKGYVPAFAAVLLCLGALGTWGAIESGEDDGGLIENRAARAEALLDAHESWAERTLTASLIAAAMAIAAASLARFPRTARSIATAAALAALVASWTVYETGHRGGALVYQHGVGVDTAQGSAQSGGVRAPVRRERDHDKD